MEYGKIIAVTGLPGLFELLSSKNDGAIVRSLEDKSTKFVSSRVHNFSHLESIEVFTVRDNVNLTEIFHAMEKEGGKVPDGKDPGTIRKYFEKIFPDLDFERVYSSDLKKMIKWFDVLKENNIEIKLTERAQDDTEQAGDEAEAVEETVQEEVAAEKPEKTSVKKKAAPKQEKETEAKAPRKAAPKKAPAKKK